MGTIKWKVIQLTVLFLTFFGHGFSQGWDTLGSGFANGPSGSAKVKDVAAYKGDIYAAGYFTALYDGTIMNYISSWNGINWVSLGTGMNGSVRRIQPYDSLLYIGGNFTQANGMPANFIASWDGTQFDTLKGGLNGEVKAMTEFDGKLIVGGDFTFADDIPVNYVASWDGLKWDSLGSGLANKVLALGEWDGELYAGGKLSLAFGDKIAKWNGGTWGTINILPNDIANVHDFIEYDGNLVVCGSWNNIGGVSSPSIAMYDGISWHPLGAGLNSETVDLEVYNGQLYATGHFNSGGGTLWKVGRWFGSGWRDLQNGIASGVGSGMAFWPHNKKLYFVGDQFTQIGLPSVSAKRIAVWDICPYYTAAIAVSPLSLDLSIDSIASFFAGPDLGGGETTWLWDFGDGSLDTAQNPLHSYSVPDTYNVSMRMQNGFCSDTVSVEYIVELSTSGRAIPQEGFEVFPIPSKGKIRISIPGKFVNSHLIFRISDMKGNPAFNPQNMAISESIIDLSSLPHGIYFYQILFNEKILKSGKVVIVSN